MTTEAARIAQLETALREAGLPVPDTAPAAPPPPTPSPDNRPSDSEYLRRIAEAKNPAEVEAAVREWNEGAVWVPPEMIGDDEPADLAEAEAAELRAKIEAAQTPEQVTALMRQAGRIP